MARQIAHRTPSPAYRKFMDLMQHGDDFLKYELLREARAWYKKALSLDVKTIKKEKVREKIVECEKKLAFERRVIWILVAIAVLFIGAFIVFGK
jgi:hypothetical protein